nr:immunoglobulin light chain junction region [Macaca mulatta]
DYYCSIAHSSAYWVF